MPENNNKWLRYVYYFVLALVASSYGYATTSYLRNTTAATPKLTEALLSGNHR